MANKAEGTEDLFGARMRAWEHMQRTARETFEPYGFGAIETPAMEQVSTFVHGIGESTDVVRKEMFRVFSGALLDRVFQAGNESGLKPKQRLAMRPEGTAGVVRAAVENNFVPQGGAPVKLWYAEPMFRGERPQKGRLRQFHQVGVEWLGAPDPAADAECIIMLMDFYKALGIDPAHLHLAINSMGDAACRPAYREKVRQFILDHADEMCDECRERAEINPLRAFDCKNAHCREVMADAPLAHENLCEECAAHYEQVKRYLDEAGIAYEEYTVSSSNEIQSVVETMVGQVDAVYAPTDNTIAAAMAQVSSIADEAGVPVIVGCDTMVEDGGTASYSINYFDLGHRAGEMAVRILTEGADPAEMPIEYLDASECTLIANQGSADACGIDLSVLDGPEIV